MLDLTKIISIREFKHSDINFILDSSIQCLSRYKESIVKGLTNQDAFKHLEVVILDILNSPSSNIFICVLNDDPDHIIGYIVGNPASSHIYLQYTKFNYRTFGIQKNFLIPLCLGEESQGITVNFPTKEMLKLAAKGKVRIINKHYEDLISLNHINTDSE